MRFRSLAALGVTMAIVSVAACNDTTNPNGFTAGGLYALTSVNNAPLPFTYSSGSNTITLQSDVYTLNGNGTYSEVIAETINTGYSSSPGSDNEAGTWSQNGNVVNFYPTTSTIDPSLTPYAGSMSTSGAYGNNVIVFNNGSEQEIYQHE